MSTLSLNQTLDIAQMRNLSDIRYSNGFTLQPILVKAQGVNLDVELFNDMDVFNQCCKPILDETDINPPQLNLIHSIFSIKSNPMNFYPG